MTTPTAGKRRSRPARFTCSTSRWTCASCTGPSTATSKSPEGKTQEKMEPAIPMNKTILLAEDNPDDVELIRLALEKSAVPGELIVARDGVEALAVLAHLAARTLPQLVLLD